MTNKNQPTDMNPDNNLRDELMLYLKLANLTI